MVLQHADYTVGWLCSTPTDLTPATSMLDKRHPDLQFIAGDPNIYILGRVAGHNVVITCLSHTTHGPSSPADVAKNLMRSFPGVRNSLLVGVGGGVPSSTVDIRLGDVVVSTPNKVDSGVMQCKVSEGKAPVEIIGWLERPPHALLGAVNKVREKSMKPQRHIKKAILRYPEVKEHSTFPGRKQDLLFQSDYNHHEGDRCNNCSPSEIIERARRNSTDPIIHYGSIASVDIVVRNTSLRDRMSQISGVIGIDMEAVGLKQDFPCMIIRGIANYSDSHSNTKFQKYAAMTAAAYAKELLASLDAASAQKVTIAADEVSVDKTIVDIAQILASNPRVDGLLKMFLLRRDMTLLVFLRHLAADLNNLGGDMIKSTKAPVEPATGRILRRYKQAIATKIYELLQPPDVERQQQLLSAFRKN
jgi:nucleoside phosphorylase